MYTQSNYDAQCKHISQIQIQRIIYFAAINGNDKLYNHTCNVIMRWYNNGYYVYLGFKMDL